MFETVFFKWGEVHILSIGWNDYYVVQGFEFLFDVEKMLEEVGI